MPMQALVIAHASYGHNSFFKGNYLFRTWTQADAIIDYLLFSQAVHHRVRASATAKRRWSGCSTPAMRWQFRRRPLQAAAEARRSPRSGCGSRSARSTCSSRSTSSGARCRAATRRTRARPRCVFPGGAAGEPALLPREARAAARALAARDRAHRAQARAVLLSAAPDAGDERGLGDLLALHDHADPVRRGPARRQLPARGAALAHQRADPARLRQPVLQRHQPVRARLRDVPRHPPHLRGPDRRGPRLVPRHRRLATG